MVRKIGYDPDFDANQAAEVQAGGGKPQKSTGRPYRVAFEGGEYLVGPHGADFVQPIERMDFNRFTDSPELRATIDAILYPLITGGEHEVALAVALPGVLSE